MIQFNFKSLYLGYPPQREAGRTKAIYNFMAKEVMVSKRGITLIYPIYTNNITMHYPRIEQ